MLVCTRIARYYIVTRWLQSQTRIFVLLVPQYCKYGDELVIRGVSLDVAYRNTEDSERGTERERFC
jgi:hypothetical protein